MTDIVPYEQYSHFKKYSDEMKEALRNEKKRKTPLEVVHQVEGWEYVELAYMKSRLNEHTLTHNWTIHTTIPINNSSGGTAGVIVIGTIEAVFPGGIVRRMSGEGAALFFISSKTGNPIMPANTPKTASTHAYKKAIERICEVASDIYRADEMSILEEFEECYASGLFTEEQITKGMEFLRKTAKIDKKEVRHQELKRFLLRTQKIMEEQSNNSNEEQNAQEEK